jgi:hypothetical protein
MTAIEEKCKSAFVISLNLFRRPRRAAMRLILALNSLPKTPVTQGGQWGLWAQAALVVASKQADKPAC